MQDRYAGDAGDLGKFALLRAVASGRRLGMCWYRCSGTGERNNDGRHVHYLERPEAFRELDPDVFDALKRVAFSQDRTIEALERCGLLPGATYHGVEVPRGRDARQVWFAGMQNALQECDLVFADMDNGFEWEALSPKCIARDEVRALRRSGRALLLYHHQTRRAGGASAEYLRFARWLFEVGARHVEAVRLRPYSSRFYLLVDGDDRLSAALRSFADRWGKERAEHFPRITRA